MANMREIRNRMKSIQDTMKITKAMYVVSSSKLKKAQKQYDRTKPYYKALSNTMADLTIPYFIKKVILPNTKNISSQVPVVYIIERICRKLQTQKNLEILE